MAQTWQTGLAAQYNLAGNVTDLTYPSTRTLHQKWDAAGRLQSVTDTTPGGLGTVYFDATPNTTQYTPSGALANATLGDVATEKLDYNSRLQPCRARAYSPRLPTLPNDVGNLYDRQSFYNSAASSPCGNESANNGNIWSLVDNRQPGLTQSFSYDSLNRLTSGSRSDGAYNHTYSYDSFGNMLPHDNLHTTPNYSIDSATNRLLLNGGDITYYPNGNLAHMPGMDYSYTAEGNLRSINSFQTGSYLYNAEGQRTLAVRNDVAPYSSYEAVTYVYFGGQPMAELSVGPKTGWAWTWTDNIYANGQKIARVGGADARLHREATVCGGCGWQWTALYTGVSLHGVTVHAGDRLVVSQYAAPGTRAGVGVNFTDGSYGPGLGMADELGNPSDADAASGNWHHRIIDMSAFANKVIDFAYFITPGDNGPGRWSVDYRDFAYIAADGTVTRIYSGEDPSGWFQPATPGQSGLTSTPQTGGPYPGGVAPTYYSVTDHLGSTQMELGAGGWPVWQGQFTPFGQEIVSGNTLLPGTPDGSSTRYKFTGKERDTESGLDYFGARYYASSMGRWMSPDWADKPEAVPYSDLSNPQSLNLYGYVKNNPMSQADPDGHCCWDAINDFMKGAGGAVGHDITAGLSPEGTPNSSAGRSGAFFGHALSAFQGELEVLSATGGEVAGVLLDATGAGAPVGIPLGVASAAIGVHGLATLGTAVVAMGNGSYTNTHQSGAVYNGKGNRVRSGTTGKEVEKATGDKHVATDHTPAANTRESFKDESKRIDASGGVGSTKNYNKIESPGKKVPKTRRKELVVYRFIERRQ